MELLDLDARPASALGSAGLRGLARRIGVGAAAVPPELLVAGRRAFASAPGVGRVHSAGRWDDVAARAQLSAALGPLATALRPGFEWYGCRGAHFHTDAHYGDVLFGVWMITGPEADVVFARGARRVAVCAGSVLVFDPFEVHGVLRPGAATYVAGDYDAAATTVFAGFELNLDAPVRAAFGVAAAAGPVISSATRVAADTGALD